MPQLFKRANRKYYYARWQFGGRDFVRSTGETKRPAAMKELARLVRESKDQDTLEEQVHGDRVHGNRVHGHPVNGVEADAGEEECCQESVRKGGQSALDDGIRISAETSRRIACDASTHTIRHAEDGSILDVGRKTRTITADSTGDPACDRASGRWLSLSGLRSEDLRCASCPALGGRWRNTSRQCRCCCAGGTIEPCTKRALGGEDGARRGALLAA